MMQAFHNKKEKGFTLIELMIVVAIIGILAAIAIPQFSQFKKKAQDGKAASDIGGIRTAETSYYTDYDVYKTVGVTQAASTGPISGLDGASASKDTNYIVNVTGSGSSAAFAAFTGNVNGSKVYGATDSALQFKSATASQLDTTTHFTGITGVGSNTDLSAFAGTAL